MNEFYPKRWTADELVAMHKELRERDWASLYQQAPYPPEHEPPQMPTETEIAEQHTKRPTVSDWLQTMKPDGDKQ